MNATSSRAGDRRRGQVPSAPRPGGRAAARKADTQPTVPPETTAYATRGSAALAPQVVPDPQPRAGRAAGVPWLKVAPPLPVSVPRAPFVLLLLFVVVGGVLGILLVNTKINENAFRLDKLQQQQAALDQEEQGLKQQIADYESPGNLVAEAKKLGLVPGSPAFIRLPDGRVIGVPRPAGGAPSITSGNQASGG
jgi:hypothetical protein